MAAQTDFWGEIAPAAVRTPLAILREQAALLGAKTKNLIEATVATSVNGPQFQHRFNLVVPSLGNYTYELFWVTHGIEMYPIIVPLAPPKDRVNNGTGVHRMVAREIVVGRNKEDHREFARAGHKLRRQTGLRAR